MSEPNNDISELVQECIDTCDWPYQSWDDRINWKGLLYRDGFKEVVIFGDTYKITKHGPVGLPDGFFTTHKQQPPG